MTTKPKTRKAPAAKPATPKNGATVAPSEPKREVSEIRALVSRWRWLEADANYKAATAPTVTESGALLRIHHDEQEEIKRKLATLVPETYQDACCLLEFATEMAAEGCCDDLEISMLKNVLEGLPTAWGAEMEAGREKANKEAIARMFSNIEYAVKIDSIIEKGRKKRAAA
jgi:hypothetical protein